MRASLLVAAALLALCAVALGGACEAGQFGGDCSCTSDVETLLAAVSAPHTANCSAGVWTLTGSATLAIGDATWRINTDTVRLLSNFSSGAGAELHWRINDLRRNQSGLLDLRGFYGDFQGFASFEVVEWNRNFSQVPIKLPFVRYSTRNTARQFQPRTATVIDKYRLCWKVANTQANATDAQGVIFAQIALNKVEGVDCETGTVDRSWVIAFIVLLFLWGLMFGLIWLVTCKIESCHEKFWEE